MEDRKGKREGREEGWRRRGGGLDAIQTRLVLTKYSVVSCDVGEVSLGLFKLATSQLLTGPRKYSQLRGTLILWEAFLRSEHVSPEVQRLNKVSQPTCNNGLQCHHAHSARVKPCNNQAGP